MTDRELIEEIRTRAEALGGERWYAMCPPWSGQFVLSGDEDPHAGRFVCSTDPALHMDEEDLADYEDDDPGERSEFIARLDPATVLKLCDVLEHSERERERLREALRASRSALLCGEPYGGKLREGVERALEDERG